MVMTLVLAWGITTAPNNIEAATQETISYHKRRFICRVES